MLTRQVEKRNKLVEKLMMLFSVLGRLNSIITNETPEEIMEKWVICDKDLPTTSKLSDAEIIQLIQDDNYSKNDGND